MENQLLILVVEDDQFVQSIVEECLSEGGFEAVIAPSGENAVELLDAAEGKYRAFVTDINPVRERSTAGTSHSMPEKSTLASPSYTRAEKTPTIGHPGASPTASCWRSRSRPLSLSLLFPSFSMRARRLSETARLPPVSEVPG